MEKITDKQMQRLAELSAFTLTPDELKKMKTDLTQILGFVEQIQNFDKINDIANNDTIMLSNLREDRVKPSLSNEVALANAPKSENGAFVVPKVVD